MSIETSVMHGNEWRSEKQCPVSKSWTNMPFSRSQRSGPLSRRTPAINSQHLAKYAPLLVKANSVYNSEPTAFLNSATSTPPFLASKNDHRGHILVPDGFTFFQVIVLDLGFSVRKSFLYKKKCHIFCGGTTSCKKKTSLTIQGQSTTKSLRLRG